MITNINSVFIPIQSASCCVLLKFHLKKSLEYASLGNERILLAKAYT